MHAKKTDNEKGLTYQRRHGAEIDTFSCSELLPSRPYLALQYHPIKFPSRNQPLQQDPLSLFNPPPPSQNTILTIPTNLLLQQTAEIKFPPDLP